MTLNFWNRFGVGALILTVLTVALLWLSERSYWLMRIFFAVAVPVTMPLIVLAIVVVVTLVLTALLRLRWRIQTTRTIVLYLAILALSSFVFCEAFLTKYEIAASANFDSQKYYLVKFSYIDAYTYRVYSCESWGLLCRRSSEYIGIPYQKAPIHFQYNFKTKKVYIQNAEQIISIPEQ